MNLKQKAGKIKFPEYPYVLGDFYTKDNIFYRIVSDVAYIDPKLLAHLKRYADETLQLNGPQRDPGFIWHKSPRV